MNYLKKIGLIAAAVAAMMAFVGASSASAAEFHTNTVGATLHGTQSGSHVFTVQGSKVTCEVASFSGKTAALTTASQTMTPKYEKCTAFGFANAEVNMNGCHYVFYANGTVDFICPAGKFATIKVPTFFGSCHVDIFGSNGLKSVSYTNAADKKTLTVHAAVKGIPYNVTTSSGGCPLTTGEGTNSEYTGTTTVTAGGATIWVE
ncbi:MAG TPA: hypothetical protein VKB23_09375 [Solirubrobacterales bacterium]|nr:hypothetical protein [Solirubrobacterales bacterium]